MMGNMTVPEGMRVPEGLKPYPYADEVGKPSKAGPASASEKAEELKKQEERRDKYIPDDEKNEKDAGLYQLKVDAEGRPKIVADEGAKPDRAPTEPAAEAPVNAAADREAVPASERADKNPSSQEREKEQEEGEGAPGDEDPKKPEKEKVGVGKSFGDDSAWRAEIAQITQKKAQIAQEMSGAGDDEEKHKALAAKLAQVESELAAKNTDAYRKQRIVVRYLGSSTMDAGDAGKLS